MSRTKQLTAALLVTAFSLPAFAATDGVVELPGTRGEKGEMRQPAPATRTRSDVKSELPAAPLQGEAGARMNSEIGYAPDIEDATSTRTRQQVMQDLDRARRDGSLDQLNKEHEG
ncbi:MAG: hypothetical protein V4739_13950 [Pseudomonadota bacterium]